jgi:hypothetical protein
MAKGVKSYAASLPGNPKPIQNRMEDFLHDPSPVKRASNLVREKQVVGMPDEVRARSFTFTIGVM